METTDDFAMMMGDAAKAIHNASKAKNTDWQNLSNIGRAFIRCDEIEKEGYYHRGKLLHWAKEIIYHPDNAGKLEWEGKTYNPDTYYGKWQAANLALSQDKATRYLSFYRTAEAVQRPRQTALELTSLPSLDGCKLLMSENTPETTRKRLINKIKKGEKVTAKEVKEAIAKAKGVTEQVDDDEDVVSTQIAVDLENVNWQWFFEHFTDEQLAAAMACLKGKGVQ